MKHLTWEKGAAYTNDHFCPSIIPHWGAFVVAGPSLYQSERRA